MNIVLRAFADGYRPETMLTVSEWADSYRYLPTKSSAEPGPWRTARTPYLREIMDCLSARSSIEHVVFMKPAQVGGTEVILNAIGYVIDHTPGPALLVQPTVELAKRFSRQRVEPLVTSTARLKQKVSAARERDSGNTMLAKDFQGGILVITGANSAVGLRSIPAAYVMCDEIDAYPIDVDEEGDPLELATARQRTFARKKRLYVSTPTIEGRSMIAAVYEDSDQRRFYVPCPYCGDMQTLEFEHLIWTARGLKPEQAVYECRACHEGIDEHYKTAMLSAGEWRAERPEAGTGIRGYHINGLYAPAGWLSWGEIARTFVRTYKDPQKHRVFVNTILAKVWKEKGEAPAWIEIMKRREVYAMGTVPQGVCFLTAGCDVQKDRLVIEVVGWGRGKQSWSIDYGILPGNTDDLEHGPWLQLDELLNRFFPHAGGTELGIRALAIDSGFNTNTVYTFSRQYPTNRVFAVKGTDRGAILVGAPSPVDITIAGKKVKRGARVWPVAVNIAKTELYGWLNLEPPANGGSYPAGYCHFPEYDEEYFKEITAEQLVARKSRRGYMTFQWEVIPGRENHVLDVRVYARAAAALVGLDRYRESDWNKLEASLKGPTLQ